MPPEELTPSPELIRWAYRSAIELERFRRTRASGRFVSDPEVEIDEIDWSAIEDLVSSLGSWPGVHVLEWHLERARRVRDGQIDWEHERTEHEFVEVMGEKARNSEPIAAREWQRLGDIFGVSSIANPLYGWS
jgi:hypothetical protein